MRLLLVAEDVPNRSVSSGDGSSLISYELLRNLPPEFDVHLLTFARGIAVPDEVTRRCRAIELLAPRHEPRAALLAALTGRHPGSVARRTTAARQRTRELSRAADVTLLHGPHVLALAGDVVGPVLAQVVDPWSQRTAMDASLATGPRAGYRRLRAARALQLERGVPLRVRLLTVSRQDAQEWSRRLSRPVVAVPNGADPVSADVLRTRRPTVCFVGSLDYGPHVDSCQRLVRQVLPRVAEVIPHVRAVLAGRRPAPAVAALSGGAVDVLADVPSVHDVLLASHAAVFPDRFGVGERNSVRDALNAGLPVVATRVAARGLPPSPRLLVADDDASLAAAVIRVLRDPALAPTAPVQPSRLWADAAEDYANLIRSAARSTGA